MVLRWFAHLCACILLMEPPVALPVVVMLNTDVMAFMQMQIRPSNDVVELGFSVQNTIDSNRSASEHIVLDEFNEFNMVSASAHKCQSTPINLNVLTFFGVL